MIQKILLLCSLLPPRTSIYTLFLKFLFEIFPIWLCVRVGDKVFYAITSPDSLIDNISSLLSEGKPTKCPTLKLATTLKQISVQSTTSATTRTSTTSAAT